MLIDAHHHLWDLNAVHYPWLMEKGAVRFFGDPTPIQKNYLMPDFQNDLTGFGFGGSVHIQVGAADPWEEAKWVQSVADANPDWPLAQVVFCDLTAPDLDQHLDRYQTLPSVRGIRQIVGRARGEDVLTGTNQLLEDPRFAAGLREVGRRGLSFDLQLIPDLMAQTAKILETVPHTSVALCHAGSPQDRTKSGLSEWGRDLKSLSNLSHVTAKMSGLVMFDHDWTKASLGSVIDEILQQFGDGRVMFGSNFPVDKLHARPGDYIEAMLDQIPDAQRTEIFGNTAKHFYRFP